MEKHFQRLILALAINLAVCFTHEIENSVSQNDGCHLKDGESFMLKDDSHVKGDQKPFGQSGSTSRVTEVSKLLSSANFFEDFFLASKPVLLKGAAKTSPAFHKWTDSYLRQIASKPENAGVNLQVETQKKESREQEGKEMTLTEFLTVYNGSELYVVDEVPSFLEPDLLMPCVLQCPDLEMVRMSKMMWYSSGGTKSVVHTDSYDNVNCLFRGNKSLVLIDPSTISIGSLLDRPEGSYSDIDVDRVDLYRYPSLRGAQFLMVDMEAGDCLYIPYLWIHQVRSFNSNLAVNFWLDHYEVLDLLQSNHCKEDEFICDPTSTLDLWLNPPSDPSDTLTSADSKMEKDFFQILFQYGASHVDRLFDYKDLGPTEEKVKIDTLMQVVESYLFPDLEQKSLDVISVSRRNLRQALVTSDDDENGILSFLEFKKGHNAMWEIIIELMVALYGSPKEDSLFTAEGSESMESDDSISGERDTVEGREEQRNIYDETSSEKEEL